MPQGIYPRPSPEQRFWAKVDKHGEGGCWLWTGSRTTEDYGSFKYNGGRLAHRFAYELLVGPIPAGLTLDHLCRVRHCVRPVHLEPVTSRENTLRGETLPAANRVKTHCPQGHPYDQANTKWWHGKRECRACNRAQARRNQPRRNQLKALRRLDPASAADRKPCLRCGGPKEPGERRKLCVACKGC